jgi:hypothetical protein
MRLVQLGLLAILVGGTLTVLHIRSIGEPALSTTRKHLYISDTGKWVAIEAGHELHIDVPPDSDWNFTARGGLDQLDATDFLAKSSAGKGQNVISGYSKSCRCGFKVDVFILRPETKGAAIPVLYSLPNHDYIDHP